jgi:hypothetical protein
MVMLNTNGDVELMLNPNGDVEYNLISFIGMDFSTCNFLLLLR